MKTINKILAVTVLLIVLSTPLSVAQDIYIMGGVNFSQLNVEKRSTPERSYRPGFHMGSAIDIKINENFNFSPRLLFSLKREYVETTFYFPQPSPPSGNNSGATDKYQFNHSANEYYLDLPLNIKYSFSVGKLNLFTFAGPFINLMLKDNSNTEFFINSEPEEIGESLQGKFINRIDYGLNAGFGVEMNSYFIEASYDHGFYRDQKYEDFDFVQSLRNSVFRMTFGYKF